MAVKSYNFIQSVKYLSQLKLPQNNHCKQRRDLDKSTVSPQKTSKDISTAKTYIKQSEHHDEVYDQEKSSDFENMLFFRILSIEQKLECLTQEIDTLTQELQE